MNTPLGPIPISYTSAGGVFASWPVGDAKWASFDVVGGDVTTGAVEVVHSASASEWDVMPEAAEVTAQGTTGRIDIEGYGYIGVRVKTAEASKVGTLIGMMKGA
jgi:hypothetical protein